jgi:radical SAM protein with 4Fe4S-binding SPASM domain
MIKEFAPKWIAWEITRRCNLRCVHCRSSSEEEIKGHPDFTTGEAFRVLEDIASYAKPVIVLSGANGTMVTEEICGKIKDSGIRIVSLSLDGSTEAVHDDFRSQEGAFAGAINAAKLFKKHGIEFIINSSFTKRNQEDIPRVYRLAKELGATAWYMFMIVPTGRGEEIMNELISKEDYEDILKWHYEMEKEEDVMLVRPTCAPHYYRIVLQKNKESEDKLKRRTLKFSTGGAKGCIAGQLICLIDVDGNVLPCSYFPKSAGNVREQPFKDIWENSELFKSLRDFKSYKGRCGSCEYINVCGGCRARAYSVYGDYLEEEPFCSYVPFKMKKDAVKKKS